MEVIYLEDDSKQEATGKAHLLVHQIVSHSSMGGSPKAFHQIIRANLVCDRLGGCIDVTMMCM